MLATGHMSLFRMKLKLNWIEKFSSSVTLGTFPVLRGHMRLMAPCWIADAELPHVAESSVGRATLDPGNIFQSNSNTSAFNLTFLAITLLNVKYQI